MMKKYSVTTTTNLRELCIKNNWFTDGSNEQYEKLFYANEYGCPIEEIATIIWLCSDNKWHREDILSALKEERAAYLKILNYDFEIDENGVLVKHNGNGGDVVIPDEVAEIGNLAFFRCEEIASITIPDSVTRIGDSAFYGCTGLTSVTIPNSVKSIGYGAFGGCTGLTSVTIPNSVTSIGNFAFEGCTSLASVTIPSSVASIGDYAFRSCMGLTSVTIPNSVKSIGYGAFDGCTGLTSITIPNSVTSIDGYAFLGCTGLESITVDENNPNYSSENGVLMNKAKTEIIFAPQKCLERVATNAAQTADDYNSVGQLLNNADKKIEQRQEKSKNSRKENCLNI